jgi:restriction system protein
MSKKALAKSWSLDIAQVVVLVAAAMFFLPPLRKILLWPAVGLTVVLAGLLVAAFFKRKADSKPLSFIPLPEPVRPGESTEIIEKPLFEKINQLDWLPFEKLVSGLYAALGYTARRFDGPHADGSVNLVLQKEKSKTLVQCKHWRAAEVDEKELGEFVGTLALKKFENGIFVSPREFTFGARRFAAMNNLLLVGRKDLLRLLKEADWQKNPALVGAIDQSRKFCPRCEKDMVLRDAHPGVFTGGRTWNCSGYPKCNYTVNV